VNIRQSVGQPAVGHVGAEGSVNTAVDLEAAFRFESCILVLRSVGLILILIGVQKEYDFVSSL
jgi:hypothetical protein